MGRTFTIVCLAICSFQFLTHGSLADDSFTTGTDGASIQEAEAMSLINRFRADPKGELARMFSDLTGSTYTQSSLAAILESAPASLPTNWWKDTFNGGSFSSIVFNSMDFFGTDPALLQSQWDDLPEAGTLFSYQWNGNVGWAAHQYADCVEMDAGSSPNPHAVDGAPSLGARFTDSGYTGWNNVGENIAADFLPDVLVMHMGFAIDWGSGTGGIQNGTGHRTSMLGGTGSNPFTDIGIGILDTGWTAGNVTQVQHFGNQFAEELLVGYAFQTGDCYTFDNASTTASLELQDLGGAVLLTANVDQYGGFSIDLSSLNLGAYNMVVTDSMNGSDSVNNYAIEHDGARISNQNVTAFTNDVLLGDVNGDGVVNLLDVEPFIDLISTGTFQLEGDTNQDGFVNLLDVNSFIAILSGG